jgi:hypothetical protein
MKHAAAVIVATGLAAAGCAPYPGYSPPPPPPIPLVLTAEQQRECAVIRSELARQQTIAAYSGVMTTPLVQGAVLLNTSNVIYSLQTRSALARCPAQAWNARCSGLDNCY